MNKKAGRRYQAVIFDLFGTLVPALGREEYRQSLCAMAAAMGAPVEEFIRLWNEDTAHDRVTGALRSPEGNLEHIRKKLGLPAEVSRLSKAALIRLEFYRSSLVPRADALDTLARLQDSGIRLGLISDCSDEALDLWPETPFAELIAAPVFSCCEGRRKPDPELYKTACKRLRAKPEKCLYVADGDGGELAGAVAQGMDAVRIRVPGEDGYRRKEEEWTGPEVRSLAELVPMVLQI